MREDQNLRVDFDQLVEGLLVVEGLAEVDMAVEGEVVAGGGVEEAAIVVVGVDYQIVVD